MKQIIKKILDFYYSISDTSMRIILVGIEVSALLFLSSIVLAAIAPEFTYRIKIYEIAQACHSAAVAFVFGSLYFSCAADIIVQHKKKQEIE